MSLSSYLASKYLTASPASTPSSSTGSTKKRKRKAPPSPAGLTIADDDALGWSTTAPTTLDEDTPLTLPTHSAEFRKSKKNTWKTVGAPAPSLSSLTNTSNDASTDAAAADAIIASTAAENALSRHQDDDPTIVKMSDGTHAGLQTASSLAAQLSARRRAEASEYASPASHKHKPEETVYRDATGRRIDISMRRANARAAADAKEAAARKEAAEQTGDVQLAEKAQRQEALEEARFMPLARGADDEEVNRELRARMRWDDPAARFLSSSGTGAGAGVAGTEKAGGKQGTSLTGKPLYGGPAPPNRYGIRPGYRWDGVDRSNGWEAERFKASNRKTRNRELEFAWQTDA